MDDLRFTRIKYDRKKVRLEYQRLREGADPDEYVIACGDVPAPAFVEALQALARDVLEICELPISRPLEVRGVSLSWTEDILGACVTAFSHVKTALILNTPHLPERPYGDSVIGLVMPFGMVDRLIRLMSIAKDYLAGGARAQGSLLPPSAGGSEEM